MASLPRFYVYVLARPNGKPFYVGKGKGARVFRHEADARKGCKCHKCNIIRKIWKQGGQVHRYTVFTTDDEQEALAYEVELIALYGRRTLCNLTDGGDNPVTTAETRAKLSVARRAREARMSPEEKAARSQRRIGIKLGPASEERKRKLSEANRGKVHTEEQRRHMSEAHKGQRPTNIAQLTALATGRPCSPETRRKIAASKVGKPRSPECIEKIAAAKRGQKQSLEIVDKRSITQNKGRTFVLIAPDGTEYRGIINLARFGREHGMSRELVHSIIKGRYKNKAGWRGFITYEEEDA